MAMTILNYSLCIIEYLTNFIIYFILFKKDNISTKKQIINLIISTLISGTFIFIISDASIVTKAFCSIILSLLGTIIYREKLHIRLAFSITFVYILFIIDIVIGNLFSIMFKDGILDVFYSSFSNRMIICLLIKLLNIIVLTFIYKSFKKVNLNMKKSNWILYNIIMFVFLIISITFMILYPNASQMHPYPLIFFIISFAFFIMSIIVIHFFTEICANFQHEKKIYLLESNYSILEEQLSLQNQTSVKLSKMRHDIKNHIMNANILLSKGAIDETKQILMRINEDTDNISIELEETTGNNVIDTIIAYKAASCNNKNIALKYNLEPLPNVNINTADISSLVSNLFDNAIEAAEKSDESFIDIKIFCYKDYLTISIKNSYNSVETNKNGVLISTKKDKELHGYGTQIIKEIAEKYNGNYTWNAADKIFTSTVLLNI